MQKKNEQLIKLLDDLNSVLGDTSKSAEIFYLLKKQGENSKKQKEEVIKLERQILENQNNAKGYAIKFVDLVESLNEYGEISQKQWSQLIELEKRVFENQKDTKNTLLNLIEVSKTLKIKLPESFDVKIKNSLRGCRIFLKKYLSLLLSPSLKQSKNSFRK